VERWKVMAAAAAARVCVGARRLQGSEFEMNRAAAEFGEERYRNCWWWVATAYPSRVAGPGSASAPIGSYSNILLTKNKIMTV
jgi:hypothetical protein